MRRKSPRTAQKATPSEKTKSPTRKTRRYTRRKKQSTSESSDDSQDEQSLQEIAKQASAEASKTPAKDENAAAEAVWKVTPSSDSSTGEIQKLKISLTRPSPSTPERTSRRRRNKSGGGVGEERNEESSTQEDEKNSEVEERDERRGKGKSKGKHKSKIEKTAQTSEQEAEMQSEISANVQVTAQSPPHIDIPVDQIENVNDCENNEEQPSRELISDAGAVEIISSNNVADEKNNVEDVDAPTLEKQTIAISCEKNDVQASPPRIEKEVTTTTIENHELPTSQENTQNDSEESPRLPQEKNEQPENQLDDNKSSAAIVEESNDLTVDKEDQVEESQEKAEENKLQTVVVEVEKSEQNREEEKAEEEKEQSDKETMVVEDVVENKVDVEESVVTNEENSEKTEEIVKAVDDAPKAVLQEESAESVPSSQIETTTTESFVEYMEVDVSETEHFRNQSEEITQEQKPTETTNTETVVKQPKKRKWGKQNQALQRYFTNIVKVDVDAIKKICHDVKLLDESEIKLESTPPVEKKPEPKQKKPERKVSIAIDDQIKPELTTQTSINSDDAKNNVETNTNIIAMNRKISIVDDAASKLKPPPSPAKNPISEILYITNLVRPFTIKQLKELLERTGKIKENGFWTDHIKSKCFVHYETLEEAEATRNALHGVQWPIGNGKKLIIEFSTVDEMEMARNPPQTPPIVAVAETKSLQEKDVAEIPAAAELKDESNDKTNDDRREKRRKEQTQMREWDIGKESLERRRSRSRERDRKRHGKRSASPIDDFITRKQKKQEEAVPPKLMDDLFQKTKATPCIYWLPLTPEEIALKQQQRLLRMEEHKRRMEEQVKSRGGGGGGGGDVGGGRAGGPYRRRDFAAD